MAYIPTLAVASRGDKGCSRIADYAFRRGSRQSIATGMAYRDDATHSQITIFEPGRVNSGHAWRFAKS